MLNAVTVAALGALALAAPAAVPAVPAVPAAPAVPAVSGEHFNSMSWGEGAQVVPASLDWQVRPAEKDAPAGAIEFGLGFHTENRSQNWTRNVTLGELGGLSAAQLQSDGQPVSFTLHRDA